MDEVLGRIDSAILAKRDLPDCEDELFYREN